MERSLDMVEGILGISKSRWRLCADDPAYPQERLAFMLGRCTVPVWSHTSGCLWTPAHKQRWSVWMPTGSNAREWAEIQPAELRRRI